jgi:hypothetical protein
MLEIVKFYLQLIFGKYCQINNFFEKKGSNNPNLNSLKLQQCNSKHVKSTRNQNYLSFRINFNFLEFWQTILSFFYIITWPSLKLISAKHES